MDEYILDLDNLYILITGVLRRMDRLSAAELSAMMGSSKLEDMVLDAIGVSRSKLSEAEQKRFSALLLDILSTLHLDEKPH